jgi:hypothetical protein
MADQLIDKRPGIEDAADTGGDGADGLELPEMEPFVEAAALEFVSELPRTQTDPRGIEGRFIEAVQMEQP